MSQYYVNSNSSGTSDVQTLTGNSGGAVGPTAGNINVVGDTTTINVVGNPGTSTLTISQTAFQIVEYNTILHSASPYTVLANDYYMAADVTSGVVSILLPNSPAVGRIFVVKDKAGLSNTSNITITTVGGVVTIDGGTSYKIATNYGSVQLLFNGVSYEVY